MPRIARCYDIYLPIKYGYHHLPRGSEEVACLYGVEIHSTYDLLSQTVSTTPICCSENNSWERRHPCLHAFIYCGQDGRAPGYIPALKMAWERRHPCLHTSINCGQDGRAPGYIPAPKMAWERRHPCLYTSIYCGQDGRAPGYIPAPKMAWERRHSCLHTSIYCGQDDRAPGYIPVPSVMHSQITEMVLQA